MFDVARRLPFVALLVVGLSACEMPKAPQVLPESVTTAKITTKGADLETTLNAFNPNKFALTASGIETRVTIGGRPNVAKAIVTDPLTLPPGEQLKVKLPIHVEWTDTASIAALAETKQPADYVVEGMVQFAGKGTTLQTQIKVTGTMTASELAQAAGVAPAPAPPPSATASAKPTPSASASTKAAPKK